MGLATLDEDGNTEGWNADGAKLGKLLVVLVVAVVVLGHPAAILDHAGGRPALGLVGAMLEVDGVHGLTDGAGTA